MRNACGSRTHDAAHRHALALAAGEGAGRLPRTSWRPRTRRALHAAVDLRLVELPKLQPEGHVPVCGHVRVQRVVLEHHRDVAVLRREIVHDPAADPHFAFGHGSSPATIRRASRPSTRRADDSTVNSPSPIVRSSSFTPLCRPIDLRQPLELDLSYRSAPPCEQLGKILPSRRPFTVYDPGRGGNRRSRFPRPALAGRLRGAPLPRPAPIAPGSSSSSCWSEPCSSSPCTSASPMRPRDR